MGLPIISAELSSPIPTVEFPSIHEFQMRAVDEDFVSLSSRGFLVSPQYYIKGVPGSYKDCYVRESLVPMLEKAEFLLPKGLRLLIYDAYRPICVQQRLWDYYYREVKRENPDASQEELERKTGFFISKPSYDIRLPSLHNTGGAIDLTICTESGFALNMGTVFDDFTNRAWTNHFESYEFSLEVRDNRRMLYNVMMEVGFTNLPSEWWHYDFGDKFWSYFKGKPVMYEGVLDLDRPNRFPLM